MTEQPHTSKPGRYNFAAIEKRWQAYWEEHQTFRTPNPGDADFDANKPKYYILDMFPYPSGSGLHVGHPVGYCATDIVARYKRMRGFNVLHPIGFDAFGLPAEQYAIETNVHPSDTTKKNIDRYRQQLKMFGFSYDWSREVSTCDPKFYKFTQWIFLRMFESWYDADYAGTPGDGRSTTGRARPLTDLLAELESGRWGVDVANNIVREAGAQGRREWADLSKTERTAVIDNHRLAYISEVPVNWCPELGTVLANEEVTNEGRSDRGDYPVYRRPLRQWMLRITKYADRLRKDLDGVDWPEPVKTMQRHWIGKSTGAEVVFPLASKWRITDGTWTCLDNTIDSEAPRSCDSFPHAIKVYTTRPDTLFGATYMVLAPEHELVEQITTSDRRDEVNAYVTTSRHRSDLDRTANTKDKTGVFTGAFAINPVSGKQIPIWVADYVLMGYGTGAIMAVPGGDTRDFEFATKFDLPIIAVVRPPASWIEERVAALTTNIEASANEGFERLVAESPEMADEIAKRRERTSGLGERTKNTLKDSVGAEKLIDHYVAHPASWGAAYPDEGIAVNSPGDEGDNASPDSCQLNGSYTADAKSKIIDWLEGAGVGRRAVNYKLRDWIFSRQKYWGEPFPVLHDEDGVTIGVGDDELPIALPPMEDFKPTPTTGNAEALPLPPLGRAKEWISVAKNGKSYRRDLNTMPQWAGSCWYYLRYLDVGNEDRICDEAAEKYWMPVDLYVGGAEHAVLHLLYARFWHKVLHDLGFVSTSEPFGKLFNQGMIQSFAFRDSTGRLVSQDLVKQLDGDRFVHGDTEEPLVRVVAKMSKALKNVVNPDDVIADCGTDTFRLYEMYMGPLDAAKPWNTRDVPGLYKLCQRIWRLVVDEQTNDLVASVTDAEADEPTLRALHKLIKRVTEDVELLKLNTAIAALFDFVNFMTPKTDRPRHVLETFVRVLAPFAPHLAEELWNRLGHENTLTYEPWPDYDAKLVVDAQVEIAVQVNGKIKARVTVDASLDEDAIKTAAMEADAVSAALAGRTVRKVIVIKGRLVNIVAS